MTIVTDIKRSNAFVDRTGHRYGRLTVISRAPKGSHAGAAWHTVCDCGGKKVVSATHLVSGHTTSCGCFHKERTSEVRTTHGLRKTRAYKVWANMLDRCRRPSRHDWHNYGGRGISVCARWDTDFQNFWNDIGHLLEIDKKLTIERIDNNGDYCPENCRCATLKEQGRNKRNNRTIDTPLGQMLVCEAAETFGLKSRLIRVRLSRGWPTSRLLEGPKI